MNGSQLRAWTYRQNATVAVWGIGVRRLRGRQPHEEEEREEGQQEVGQAGFHDEGGAERTLLLMNQEVAHQPPLRQTHHNKQEVRSGGSLLQDF